MSPRGGRAPLALLALAVALALPRPARAAAPDSIAETVRCGACHPAERVEFARSRHAGEGVTCVSCHGGDPAAVTLPAAHGRGFRGKPARKDVPKLCASCHSDEDRMRAYNLPVDQYALYQTSGHGRALAAGNDRVAVCSDCHGAHDILPPEDPASRVYTLNIPRTCGGCHGAPGPDGKPVANPGVPPKMRTYPDYIGSVHAKSLFEKGNLKAPTCVSCHGVHGAAPPAVGDVGKVCGQCHTAERRYFAAGPHQAKLAGSGLAECASCHGDHAVPASDPARLASQCASCHGKGSDQEKLGARMFADWQAAQKQIDAAAAAIARADAVPLPTEDYKARLEDARTYLSEAMPAAHSVRADLVASFANRARSVATEIQTELDHKFADQRWRYVGLVLFWFYLLLTILVLRRFQGRGTRTA